MTNGNIVSNISDQQAKILACCFELQVIAESLVFAINWLANDVRSSGLEKEFISVKALADDCRENLEILQTTVWREFNVGGISAPPANDDAE